MVVPEWEKLNLTFEIFLKTRENIRREIQLSIQERIPQNRGWNVIDSAKSDKITLTEDWQWFSITCDKQHHSHARFLILWFDHLEVDVMMRDPKVTFFI